MLGFASYASFGSSSEAGADYLYFDHSLQPKSGSNWGAGVPPSHCLAQICWARMLEAAGGPLSGLLWYCGA